MSTTHQSRRTTIKTNRKGILVGVALLAAGLVGCTYSSVDSSNAGCVYNGGTFDNKNFKKAVDPGSGRENQGVGSEVIEYPIGIIQYDVTDGLAPINVSVGGFTQTFTPTLNMTLNSEKDEKGKPVACKFIEQRLKRIGATDFYDDFDKSNWVQKFLNVSVQPAVAEAVTRVLNSADPSDVYFNVDGVRDQAALEVAKIISETLEEQLGAKYFCGTKYPYGGSAEQCGEINVVLTQPTMSAEDLAVVRAPQEAKEKADNEIKAAQEDARKAAEVAAARAQEAESAKALADAEETINQEQQRVENAQVGIDYAWCAYLASLGQDCALVAAAQAGDFPDVFTGDPADIAVAVSPETTVPG